MSNAPHREHFGRWSPEKWPLWMTLPVYGREEDKRDSSDGSCDGVRRAVFTWGDCGALIGRSSAHGALGAERPKRC